MEDNKHSRIVNRNLLRSLPLAAALALLGGCGGGGQPELSGPADASPGGLFAAQVGDGTSQFALISEAGAGWFYDDSTRRGFAFALDVAHTVVLADGTAQTAGTIVAYDENSGTPISSGTVQVMGKGHSGKLAFSYTLGNGNSGAYSLVYQPVLYEQPSALTTIAGSYSAAPTNSNGRTHIVSVTIDSTGNFSGSDSAGCSYAGTVALVNRVYNAYQLSGITETCGDGSSVSGLRGLALVIPASSSAAQQLTFSLANDAQQSDVSLSK